MKKLFTLLAAVLFTIQIQAQCITGMPNDTAICSYNLGGGNSLPFTLGGNPSIVGGVAPFNYSWSIDTFTAFPFSPTLNYVVYASHFLDDTTSSNPTLNSLFYSGGSQVFYLTITDANGLSCVDTFRCHSSEWMITMWDAGDNVILGDSIEIFPNVGMEGAIAPFTYVWSPSTFLSDTTVCCPWSSPTTFISYSVVVTDSIGCQISSSFDVFVLPTSIEEQSQNKTLLKVTDVLGRKSKGTKNTPLFYIYDDGTVEKKIIIE
ncbi:MAG: hypothetical protein H8E84_03890 [Flavobacteriales bacterium]|nr:hypothetical protein [Flavobacteriales bacterium]